ncbi:MAG TPA: HdeD family acid-resistance protein [Nitrolancea sp.]|nr:HdeD family acid-resistance protein [Nitrolancea sp.]
MIDSLRRNWWMLTLRGVIAVIFGILAIVWPGLTVLTLIIFFGAFAIVDGIFAIGTAIWRAEHRMEWWSLLVEGVLGIVIGLIAFIWPGLTALGLLYVIGAWAVITGVVQVASAIRLRAAIPNEWFLILTGVLSILWGLILFIFPGTGAIALVWLIGIFAIIYGISLIAFGLRLRNHGGLAS